MPRSDLTQPHPCYRPRTYGVPGDKLPALRGSFAHCTAVSERAAAAEDPSAHARTTGRMLIANALQHDVHAGSVMEYGVSEAREQRNN
jgi:hypothetical protein